MSKDPPAPAVAPGETPASSAASTDPEEELDLTQDDRPRPEIVTVPATVAPSPYDAEKARDDIRGKLALLLIRLLVFIVVATFVSIWLPVIIAWTKGGYIDISTSLKDTLQLLLAPVVGLVGAATGYYFGVSSQKSTPQK